MESGAFKYEDDRLKHYVRIRGWLPLCRERHQALQSRRPKLRRRLKYFTFCAVNAVDVLMLDIANVIHLSTSDRFDTVYFFDRTPDHVAQTNLRIPGAIGFAGSFIDTVLLAMPAVPVDPLAAPQTERDTIEVRRRQILQQTRQDFEASFPFDVLNLDLQDLAFKANDTVPGDVIRALRRVCEWQRKPLSIADRQESVDCFTLLFTTRVGPPQINQDYANMLIGRLSNNIANDGSLADVLRQRLGVEVHQLQQHDLAAFFEIGLPKVIATVLIEEDWFIEPTPGVLIFKFTREGNPSYDVLHFAMSARRQDPSRDQRAPGTNAPTVDPDYRTVSRRLFEIAPTVVTEDLIDPATLRPTLEEIKSRRRRYYPDEMGRSDATSE